MPEVHGSKGFHFIFALLQWDYAQTEVKWGCNVAFQFSSDFDHSLSPTYSGGTQHEA